LIEGVANAAPPSGTHPVTTAPTNTVTLLSTSPASPVARGTPVTLTATITPATAAGTVQFKDGTANLGNPVTVSNGTASGITSTLALGSHQLSVLVAPPVSPADGVATAPPPGGTHPVTAAAATTVTLLSTSPASP